MVTLVSPAAGLGGAERVLLDLVGLNPKRRSVVCFESGPLVSEVRAVGARCTVVELPASLRQLGESDGVGVGSMLASMSRVVGTSVRFLGRLERALSEHSPEVIHTNGMKAHLLASATRVRTPIVWHLHDFVSDRRLTRYLLQASQWRPRRAIANSEAVRRDARSVLPRLDIDVAWNAVDERRFFPEPREAPTEILGGPEGVVRVGLVATYARWKGHDIFLRAAQRVHDAQLRGVHFFVVGGPIYETGGSQWAEDELRTMTEQLGVSSIVTFVPFARDPGPMFRCLDVVVHASTRREPFGRVLVEAMASGTALIATRGGGVQEIVTDGQDGMLVTAGDVDGLADAVTRLVSDLRLRQQLRDGGLLRAKAFSLEAMNARVVKSWIDARGERVPD